MVQKLLTFRKKNGSFNARVVSSLYVSLVLQNCRILLVTIFAMVLTIILSNHTGSNIKCVFRPKEPNFPLQEPTPSRTRALDAARPPDDRQEPAQRGRGGRTGAEEVRYLGCIDN